MNRDDLTNKIRLKHIEIKEKLNELRDLIVAKQTLSDDLFQYEEKEVDVLVSKRTKAFKTEIRGIQYFDEKFFDEATGESVVIKRNQVISINGRFLIDSHIDRIKALL